MAKVSSAGAGGNEYNDDLFDYDIENVELDFNIPNPEPLPNSIPPTTQSKGSKKKDELGLENEVEIKRRRITVKLDEQRSLPHAWHCKRVELTIKLDSCQVKDCQD
jgi:replication fork protection complex subunit Csm3/Swi3